MERALAQSGHRGGAIASSRPIRVMLVDDSAIARAVLARMIETDPNFKVVAVAGTAEDAIDSLQSVQVDTVVLDLQMPGAGGLALIPKIIEAANGARVMIVSSLAEEGAEQTIAALAHGAADAIPKPGTGRFNGRFSQVLLERLKALGYADEAEPLPQPIKLQGFAPLRAMPADPIGVLAIGASTGGIHALTALFKALPPRLDVPILVTQHLPVPFMTVFARQLTVASGREVVVASDGVALLPDRILMAPGDAHLTVEPSGGGHAVRLTRERVRSGCMPSLDPMLASVGAHFGARGLGVVLTGMGRDGVDGASRLIACGGSVLAQDEASSAVWGMPRAIVEAGLACAVMPPEKIARRIASRSGDGACR
ncbi:MAG TPA: chemotaxis-specific protein-glutamate methyltransferase CheB [Sphingomicrobium sp.]|nr:chemotaxis-specific protein-glutamate methyltransferase CheB [Sphingomicrobium sp.]